MLEFIYPQWAAPKNIKALTTTRIGGVSPAPYASLNVGDHVGDAAEHVEQNRKRLTDQLGLDISQPQWLKQEHTTNIVIGCDTELDTKKNLNACAYDGHFTNQKNVICTIMTADCLPVFICNKQGTEVALVHAGWRGLADGIVEKTIKLFNTPSSELLVYCGPAISKQYFEIGIEVKERIGGSERFYTPQVDKAGHFLADLSGLLDERLQVFGVTYTDSGMCTYADVERFFSYRRDGVTGRMVSLLWIEPAVS